MDDKIVEISIEEVILNVKMISKIKQDEKMVVQNKILNVDSRSFSSVRRWWTSDSREDTIYFIIIIMNKAFDYLSDESYDENIYTKSAIMKELCNSIPGLENLGATYKLDNLLISKIDIIKEKIYKYCSVSGK
jgi:hypothetical protein